MLNPIAEAIIEKESEEKRGIVCCQSGLRSIFRDICRYFILQNSQELHPLEEDSNRVSHSIVLW
jgi:hypothetical protein